MDGKGRALDNIVTERLWRTIKYEEVYSKKITRVQEKQGKRLTILSTSITMNALTNRLAITPRPLRFMASQSDSSIRDDTSSREEPVRRGMASPSLRYALDRQNLPEKA